MLIDSRSLTPDAVIEADVCIVGAGLAGLALAREFARKSIRVCLLESGGLTPDPRTQALGWGENIGHPYYSLDTSRPRALGGSCNRWHLEVEGQCMAARMRPLDPIDFEERKWVPYSGWPFGRDHLDPYYERAQAACEIGTSDFEPEIGAPAEEEELPFQTERLKTVLFKFGSRAPFLDFARGLPQIGNIAAFLHANVVEIEAEASSGTVRRLQAASLEGNRFRVEAGRFVLAAGAIEIPRLLLSSTSAYANGLGNQHDLVGRFFMEHPHFWSLGLLAPADQQIFARTGLYNGITRRGGVPVLGKLCLSEETKRREQLLNYVAELVPRTVRETALDGFRFPPLDSRAVAAFRAGRAGLRNGMSFSELRGHLSEMVQGADEMAVSGLRKFRRLCRKQGRRGRIRLFRIDSMSEQLPNPASRVLLAEEQDELGRRRVKLDWRLSPVDLHSVMRSQQIMDEELQRAGLGRLFIQFGEDTPPERITGGWHHMGTTRMHSDPKKGVVDQNCRVHGLHNLYIAGPSVFPTGGYANPSLTVVALALRLADHLKEQLEQAVPIEAAARAEQ